MELVQLDGCDPEFTCAGFGGAQHRVRTRIPAPLLAVAARDAAFRRHDDVREIRSAAIGAQSFGDERFVVADGVPARCIDVRGVEQGDAGVERGMDRGQGLVAMIRHASVRQRHAAEADRGYLTIAETALQQHVWSVGIETLTGK